MALLPDAVFQLCHQCSFTTDNCAHLPVTAGTRRRVLTTLPQGRELLPAKVRLAAEVEFA
jgi:hypothetical protein